VGAYAALTAVRWPAAVSGLAAGGVVVLAGALQGRRGAWISPALLLSGSAYGVALTGRDPGFEATSIAVAALLFLAGEAAFWSLELATPVRFNGTLLARRAAFVSATALVALGAAAPVGLAASQDAVASLTLAAFGVAAAVTIVGLVARLARPALERESPTPPLAASSSSPASASGS
jgi:hypothetical protein